MKEKDIKEFEIGEHCFGPILTVNGEDYADLKKEDVLEFIRDIMENNINNESFIRETFEAALLYVHYTESEGGEWDMCEQCGSPNFCTKYVI